MPNTTLSASVIAKAAVALLDNELVFAKNVFRGYEDEFSNSVNGYTVGETVSIRKPAQFTVRLGAVASSQDVTEGKTSFTVDKQRGVDFEFTSQQLTLNIKELSERVIKPAMVQLANEIDRNVANLYSGVFNVLGTPGTTLSAFAGLSRAAERLDLSAVPSDGRKAILSPTDHWGVAGAQTALYMQGVAKSAYEAGFIGEIAGLNTYKSQNVVTHTAGTRTNGTVTGAGQVTTYAAVKDTGTVPGTQTGFSISGVGASATVKAGDVFTIANVYAVNPVTKVKQTFLQQFVVTADATASVGGVVLVDICPAIITSGAFQTVDAAPASGAAVSFAHTASSVTAQNLAFRESAFGLVTVPMVRPPGSVDCSRQSYKGLNVRVIPFYDGTNDVSKWRLDVLFGTKVIDPRQAARIAG